MKYQLLLEISRYFMDSENVMNKTLSIIKFIVIVTLLYGVISLSFRYIPFLSRYDHLVIITDSMDPVIEVGEVILIDKKLEISDIKVNHIYAFYVDINNDDKEEIVVHYIDEISKNGEQLIFKTRPEVSDQQDSWTIQERDIIGEYKFGIPKIGKGLLFLESGLGKAVIVFDIIVIYLIFGLFKAPSKEPIDIIKDEPEKYNYK